MQDHADYRVWPLFNEPEKETYPSKYFCRRQESNLGRLGCNGVYYTLLLSLLATLHQKYLHFIDFTIT